MTVIFILAGIAITALVFMMGYNLALHHQRIEFEELGHESNSLEPIFAMLDREWKYTDDLTKPFTHDK